MVTLAEKEGKSVELLVVPAVDPFDAMVQTAASLRASRLVVGVSAAHGVRRTGAAHRTRRGSGSLRRGIAFSLEITNPDRPSTYVNLGPHPPRLWPEDVDLLHNIWLRLAETCGFGSKIHHRDIVGVALRRLEKELDTRRPRVRSPARSSGKFTKTAPSPPGSNAGAWRESPQNNR